MPDDSPFQGGGGGGGTSDSSESGLWPFSGSDYISDDGDGVWARIKTGELIRENVAGLLTLIGGLAAAATEAVPNAITNGIDGLRSFAVDVVDHLFELPQLTYEQGFSAATSAIADGGIAAVVGAIILVSASMAVVAIGVRTLVE